MTFSYSGTWSTTTDQIRFKIGDTVENSGIKPNGGNFSNEEIASLYAVEGTIGRTVAALYETLATIWATYVDTKIGPRDEKLSQVAAHYRQLAKEWRDDYGSGTTVLSTGFVTRQDGYSDDIASNEA